jgi:hypothetical protein
VIAYRLPFGIYSGIVPGGIDDAIDTRVPQLVVTRRSEFVG